MIEYAVRTNSMGHITVQGGLNRATADRLAGSGVVAGIVSKEVVSREVGEWQVLKSYSGSVFVDSTG